MRQVKTEHEGRVEARLRSPILVEVLRVLMSRESLDEKERDHALSDNYERCRECQIQADRLLNLLHPRRLFEAVENGSPQWLVWVARVREEGCCGTRQETRPETRRNSAGGHRIPGEW